MSFRHPYARALLLGLVAGSRSMTPIAAIALASRRHRAIALGLAGSELVGDKLPRTPSRLAAGPLVGRFAIGVFAGAWAVRTGGLAARMIGALLGACGAAIGAYGGHAARVRIGKRVRIADPWIGAAEDVLAVGGAAAAVAL